MSKEAVENIARRLYTDWGTYGKREGLTWETLLEYRKEEYRQWVMEYVVPEFKEAG